MTAKAHRYRWLPRTLRARILLALTAFALAPVAVLAFIALCVWLENRFPGNDSTRALAPVMQRHVTKPVVDALGNQIGRFVQSRAERRWMNMGLTLEETIARFTDESVDFSQRRTLAFRLARVGSPECLAALLQVFQTAQPEHKAFMTQLIGSTGNPAMKDFLWPLLNDSDERVRLAAMRGLSAIGGKDVVARTADILADDKQSTALRLQAAQGLSDAGTPAARTALINALEDRNSTELQGQILNSLAKFDFPQVSHVFEEYLNQPDTPQSLRITATEAMSESSPDATRLLLQLARDDSDADVRAAAAWAISAHEDVNYLGSALVDLLAQEQLPDVRRRLYEALLCQSSLPAEQLLDLVRAEQDSAARIAGFNSLGRAVRQQPDSPVAAVFDRDIVPELLRMATSGNNLNLQLRAVFALRRAQTPAAQTALREIAASSSTRAATAARNGLAAQGG